MLSAPTQINSTKFKIEQFENLKVQNKFPVDNDY